MEINMKKFITTVLAPVIALTFGTHVFAAAEPAAEKKAEQAKSATKAKLIDINTATEAQLIATLGVGDEDAKKIIAGRPYYKKEELKTKNIIHTDLYEKMKKLIDAVC